MKNNIYIGLICIAVGFSLSYFLYPQVKIEEKIRYKSVIVKDVEEKIIVKNNGERVITRTIKEKTDTKIDKSLVKTPTKKDWAFGLQYDPINSAKRVSVERRIIGDIYAGVWYSDNNSYGVGVTILF